MASETRSVRTLVRSGAAADPGRDALWIAGTTYRYQTLLDHAALMHKSLPGFAGSRIAIIGSRRPAFYFSVFGSVVGGACYVPINAKWPFERIGRILRTARPDAILLDAAPDASELSRKVVDERFSATYHVAVDGGRAEFHALCEAEPGRSERGGDLLYVMFTSGSTGDPKGVPISVGNVTHYVDAMTRLFGFDGSDRFIQNVELTFDLSVHDMMLCWANGGSLFVVPEGNAPMAPRFIRELGITRCLSVPSAAAKAKSLNLLRPGSLPSLKTSFFCGEALPTSLVESWMEAAPESDLYNIYGPTEATIAFSTFDWKANRSNPYAVVPIGLPIGDQAMTIDEAGELLLSGPQVFSGYLDSEGARHKPVLVERDGRTWYRTGDLAGFDEACGFIFKGRLDSQVKLRGYRVEIGEIENKLRQSAGTDLIAVLAIKSTSPGSYDDLIGIVCKPTSDEQGIMLRLKELLPPYMMPSKVIDVSEMPKNSNDKIDYLALRNLYGS